MQAYGIHWRQAMFKEQMQVGETHNVPRWTSTADFELYLPTAPILSSRPVGWEQLTVRAYNEPADLDETFFPGGPDIYLVLVTSGDIRVDERKVDGPWVSYPIHAGDWFLSPAGGEPYALRWKSLSSKPLTTLHLHLNADLFFRSARQVEERAATYVQVHEVTGFQDPLLTSMALSLQRELQQPASSAVVGQLYAETAAQMLAVHLLKDYTTGSAIIPEPRQKLSPQQMQHLTDFILAHLNEPLSLEMLSKQIGFSPYHFARLFRRSTGESPHQFVLRKRLDVAKRLLKETDLSLAHIALTVGFPQQSYFTQAFKRYTGATPLIYRQER
jgi:AraC family transcriptional regulator